MALETPYRYLNVAGRWPGARLDGLAADDDGRVRLAPGPDVPVALVELEIDPAGGLAGLACSCDQTIYVADPGGGRVLRVDPCDGRVGVLGCLHRATGDPAAPRTPRGLALGARGTLVVADPPTGRVLVVDRATGAILDVWTAGLVEPWAVAVDDAERVLVADAGARTVRRFAHGGEEDRDFAAAASTLGLRSPRAVAVGPGGAIVVVDQGDTARVLVLDAGGALDVAATSAFAAVDASAALALALAGETTWLAGLAGIATVGGGGATQRPEPVAFGAAADRGGCVLLATPSAIVGFAAGPGATHGTLVTAAPRGLEPWDRVRVILAEPLPPDTHVRVWTRADASAAMSQPPVAGDDAEAPLPTAAGTWRAAPLDVLDVRPLLAPAEALWIAVEWHGDGVASPVVDDIRVDRMGRGWLDELPHALVAESHDPLARLLALLASVYEDVAGAIDALPGLLDASVAPDRPDAPWLARLARWVDVEPVPRLTAADRRALVRDAIAAHERRGTVRGIVDAVRRDAGVEVTISEPAPVPAWPLGKDGTGLVLGSVLAAAPAGPPVLDATAIVDRSWLIDPAQRGLPLLGDRAHRFCVLVPAAVLSDPRQRAAVERVVEREKPSHTVFELAASDPRTFVGTERVGLDALAGGSDEALRLDGAGKLGSATVLRGHRPADPPAPGRVGKTTIVGVPDPERTEDHHD